MKEGWLVLGSPFVFLSPPSHYCRLLKSPILVLSFFSVTSHVYIKGNASDHPIKEVKKMMPTVICPNCLKEELLNQVLTAQSNQNVIFHCQNCGCTIKNIETSKG